MAQYDVFLSYARSDADVAAAFVKSWRSRGRSVWYDGMLPGGADWRDSIVNAIGESRLLVILFSAESNRSSQIIREIGIADRARTPVIPVLIEADVQPTGSYLYELSHRNWINLTPNAALRADELALQLEPLLQVERERPQDENGSQAVSVSQSVLASGSKLLKDAAILVTCFLLVFTVFGGWSSTVPGESLP